MPSKRVLTLPTLIEKIGIRTILAMRKMKNGGPYKPYAIIDQYAFENNVSELQKGTPL